MRFFLGPIVCLALAAQPVEQPALHLAKGPEVDAALAHISEDSLRGNLSFLSSDALEGRGTPSRGLDIAAEYIAAQFRRAGLEAPVGGTYFETAELALAFVADPPVFVLDEPTSGLDPQMRREVQDHIQAMKQAGRAVLLATHDMDEAERLCDRLAVIADGHIIATGTSAELIARLPSASLEEVILRLTARS